MINDKAVKLQIYDTVMLIELRAREFSESSERLFSLADDENWKAEIS